MTSPFRLRRLASASARSRSWRADLNAERARALAPILQRRILGLYVRRGLLTEADAQDMLTWRGTGGFSLDGSVRIAAHDRAGLERLLRYCARPPFALHRLRPESARVPLHSPDARLIYELPRPAHDGRTVVRVSPLDLLDRLARLQDAGISVVRRVPLHGTLNRHNLPYVRAKVQRAGHWLGDMLSQPLSGD